MTDKYSTWGEQQREAGRQEMRTWGEQQKAEGFHSGVTAGKAEGKTDMLRIAMHKNGWTPEQTFDFFDIPVNSRAQYAL